MIPKTSFVIRLIMYSFFLLFPIINCYFLLIFSILQLHNGLNFYFFGKIVYSLTMEE